MSASRRAFFKTLGIGGAGLVSSRFLTPAEIDQNRDINNTRAGHGIRIGLQQRIRELEERLEQERRAREAAEHLVQKLENQIATLTARHGAM